MRFLLMLAAWVTAAGVALAQPRPGDSVTMEDREPINRFIETFAVPTMKLGKLARWDTGICPIVAGLRPAAITFLTQRVRDTALKVGAPVNDAPNCRPNVEIVFTTNPQGLLDNVRKKNPAYLGHASTASKADRLAIVTHPIQAWYTTASKDVRGVLKIDNARTGGAGDLNEYRAAILFGGNASGLGKHDGRSSTLHHVIIAVDPNKLLDHEMGSIADYISFLALSQIASLGRCGQLASITSMMASDCPAAARAMTRNDLAFLRGLYRMTLDGDLRVQKDGIGYEMAKVLQDR